jgi:hypothetical protein
MRRRPISRVVRGTGKTHFVKFPLHPYVNDIILRGVRTEERSMSQRNLTFGPYGRLPSLIALKDHPYNTEPTAKLVTIGPSKGRDIYSTRFGFIALIDDHAFCDLFPTKEDAEFAQSCYDAQHL